MLIWAMTGGIHFDYVVKVASGFLYCKASIFPFAINYLGGDPLRLLIPCVSPHYCLLILASTEGSSVKQSFLCYLPTVDLSNTVIPSTSLSWDSSHFYKA